MTTSISDAAAASELSIDTIRYYDRLGIIRAVSRTPGGARVLSRRHRLAAYPALPARHR
jgi:DNA-binding transcriptional MerR regulator